MSLNRRDRRFGFVLLERLFVMEPKQEDESIRAWTGRHWRNILWGAIPWAAVSLVLVVVAIEYWWTVPAGLLLGMEWLNRFWNDIGLEGHLFLMGLFFLWLMNRVLRDNFQGIHRRLDVVEDLLRGPREPF